uniref:Transmembrane protein n=1 Tax=Panagrolaimus sp. JU765 TaxID=591449 RepID=A0AC34RIC8_9BILA
MIALQLKLVQRFISPMFLRVLRHNKQILRSFAAEAKKIKGTGKDGEVTTVDILKWREQQKNYVREMKVGDQTVKWNYRSEMVNRHGLDNNHRYTWVAIGVSIIFGFCSFVAVKTNVIENRKLAMAEREEMRKMLHLSGEDRKKIGVV